MMEPWHFDLAADLDQAQREQVRELWRESGRLVYRVRSLAALVLRCWLDVYHRLTIVGWHNLPADRSCLLIANHASHLDTLCLLSALPLRRLHRTFPVVARDYFCVSPLRALLARAIVNALP